MILSGGHAPDFEVFHLRGSSRGLGISHWRTSHFLQHSYSLFFWMDTHPCLIMSGIQSDCHYGDRLETFWNSFNLPVGHGWLNAEALYIHPRFRRICVLPQLAMEPLSHWAMLSCGWVWYLYPEGCHQTWLPWEMGIYIWANHRTKWRIFPANHVWLPEGTHKGRECLEPEDHDSILSQSAWRSATSWQVLGYALVVLRSTESTGNALRFTQPGASASQFPEEHQGTGHGQQSHHTSIP